jgi:uncharacterized protein (TIGR02444 family)
MSVDNPDWPASAFWNFSLRLYAHPGVEAACLALQDEHRLDVNLVLLAGWATHTGRGLDMPLARALRDLSNAYQAGVMQPLREARRGLKAYDLESPLGGLARDRRQALLGLELDLERLEQLQLEQRLAAGPDDAGSAHPVSFAANVAALYPDRDLPRPLLATLADALTSLPMPHPSDRASP